MPSFDPAQPTAARTELGSADAAGRRLVEAGVRLVTVDFRWWDTHVLGFDSLRRGFLPRWDRAFTARLKTCSAAG